MHIHVHMGVHKHACLCELCVLCAYVCACIYDACMCIHVNMSLSHLLADVLCIEEFPTSLALEAAQVPVLVQSHQGLAILDF